MAAQPLFGRAPELAVLAQAVDADRPVVIVGEAGIGKTALARAAAVAAGRSLREGGAFSTLRTMPYLALRRATGMQLAGDPATVAGTVERSVGPDLLLVDDLQWADEQTISTLPLLVGRVAVLACIRSLEPGSAAALATALSLGMQRVDVDPLTSDAARAMVLERRPGLSARVVDGIIERAAGNPLLIEEMAERGEASPVIARILTSRIEQLSAPARDAVALLAVAERPLPRSALHPAVDEAVAVGIAVERQGTVALRHQLVEAALRDSLGADELARIHAHLAGVVGNRAEAARHLARAGKPDEAAEAALLAARDAIDPRERAELLVIAAEARPAGGATLRLEAARALDEVSEWPAIDRILAALGDDATAEERVEGAAILAQAAYARGDIAGCRGHVAAAEAIPVPAGSRAAVRWAIESATTRVNLDGDVRGAVEGLAATEASVAADSEAATDLRILRESILLLASGGGDAEAIRGAADAALEAGRFRTATDRARIIQYLLLFAVGSRPALDFLLDRYRRYDAADIASIALDFLADAVIVAVLDAEFERAIEIADSILEQPAPPRARQRAEVYRARASTALGRIDEAQIALEALLPDAMPDWFGRGLALQALTEAAVWGGRPGLALEYANATLAVAAPVPVATIDTLVLRAWAMHELGLAAEPLPNLRGTPSTAGAAPEIEGLIALHGDDPATAADRFRAAAAGWAGFNTPRELVCRWAAGDAARLAGHATAVDDLRAVLDAADAMAFRPVVARARRSLRLAGVRVPSASHGPRSSGRLTPREEELVRLVERGLTNVEIARRLGLGRPTVARILSTAMAKVGVGRRTGLIGAADT